MSGGTDPPIRPYRIGEQVLRRPVAPAGITDNHPNAALLALGSSVRRREGCDGHQWPPFVTGDRATDNLLRMLSVSTTPAQDLLDVVANGRYTPTQDDSATTHYGIEQLRIALTGIVTDHCEGERSFSSPDMAGVVAALDAAHGLTPSLLTHLIEAYPSAVPDAYHLHPDLDERRPAASIRRTRELLSTPDRFLPADGSRAVVALASELSYAELSAAMCRMTSAPAIQAVLDVAGSSAERLAFDLLRNSAAVVVEPAARLLGDRACPLLRRQLRRRTFGFGRDRAPVARELVGATSLRLAAERALRSARDPVEAVIAYALLPGEEARDPLRRLLDRTDRLDPEASTAISFHTARTVWMVVATRELSGLVEPTRLTAALRARRMEDAVATWLLRDHPDACPEVACELWSERGWAAASVLRATGRWRTRLASEALARADEADDDREAAASVTQALEAQGADDPEALTVARAAVSNRALPATLRAIAAWVAGEPPCDHAPVDDPVIARYLRWRERRAPCLSDPLAELQRGQWLAHVLTPDPEPCS